MVATYNDIGSVEECFRNNPVGIAAVIVEPVAANMGVVPPEPGFLKSVAEVARTNGALLICDEVINGFRMSFGAVSEAMGVEPDLVMLGKIIGGGMPVGAVAGRAEYLDLLAPSGAVYQAGTLSGNPLSVRAGLETLKILQRPGTYERLESAGARLEAGLARILAQSDSPGCVNRVGSLLTLFLGPAQVRDAEDARRSDTGKFARFFHSLVERRVNIPPSQFEAIFISLAHSDADIDATIEAAGQALVEASRS
jgi:glutamate-1-semialdehyde 2,1-aminomutase